MKQFWNILTRYAPWLLLLLSVDGFSMLLLWLSDASAFGMLIGMIVLASLLLFAAIAVVLVKKEKRKQELFQDFLTESDVVHTEELLNAVSEQEKEQIRLLASVLTDKQNQIQKLEEEHRDYEEYVESWAHEVKTPLSLLTMILDNRADELSTPLRTKLGYVCSQFQEDITQILYYARLGSSVKDYRFEAVNLQDTLEEVLEEYTPLLEEKGFLIESSLQAETVYTDRRGLQFMLGQIISNSIKYSRENPKLTVSLKHSATAETLMIADNGSGVKSYDLPYIFQKGFTGDSTDSRKKATGMGLYLTRKMADDLNLKLEADSHWGDGMTISIVFPKVK
jgi:signal transduction histidine kinase